MIWTFAGSGVTKLAAVPLGLALLHGPLNRHNTWVIGQSPYAPKTALELTDAKSLAELRRTLEPGHGALLDLERWRFTPRTEQRHPAAAFRAAVNWARQHGSWLLEAPALDLFAPPRLSHYLRSPILRRVSARAFDIQAQGLERNPRLYAAFVRRVVRRLRQDRPNMVILAGLSTNPGGARVTLRELRADYRATRAWVDGYWLNIPSPGRYCPRCNPSNPRLAVAFLRSVTRRDRSIPSREKTPRARPESRNGGSREVRDQK
jgi:hypothetical protein